MLEQICPTIEETQLGQPLVLGNPIYVHVFDILEGSSSDLFLRQTSSRRGFRGLCFVHVFSLKEIGSHMGHLLWDHLVLGGVMCLLILETF